MIPAEALESLAKELNETYTKPGIRELLSGSQLVGLAIPPPAKVSRMVILRRILTSRPEVQAAAIATLNLVSLHPDISFDPDFLAGFNIALTTWFAMAAKLAFGKDIEELSA